MGNEWINTTLGDVTVLQRGFDLPTKKRKYGSYPVIASTGQVGFHNESRVKGPGVVIGRSGSIGGGQYIESDFWPLNTTLWVKDFKKNDKRFCYYLLKSIDFQYFNAGSGVPTLNRNHIHPLPVTIPPLPEQKAIAHILGTLDDKIELNRQINETLESIARAIFKSWFIDFDPVKAKMEGKKPVWMNEETAALFPDSFEDSALGLIPKGHRVCPLEDTMESIIDYRGKTPKKTACGIPLVTAKIVKGGRINLFKEFISPDDYDSWMRRGMPKAGDVVMTTEAPLGEIAQLDDRKVALAQRIITLRGEITTLLNGYLRFLMQSALFQNELLARASGTTVLGIKQKELRQIPILIPPIQQQKAFAELTTPLTMQIDKNWAMNETLSEIRDTLLPKLLSGELRIKDAEKFMEKAL